MVICPNMTSEKKILPPFSFFGGKRRVADIVWERFGNITNYVEPFCGALSVLLANPNPSKIETINDIDCHLINWWRAVSNDPDGVAKFADFPVSEAEMHARHKWILSETTDDFRKKIEADPDFYDVKMGGFYVYGKSASIGSNWLQNKGLKALPLLSSSGSGIFGLNYSIKENFEILHNRLKRVRMACGDWKRLVTPSLTYGNPGLGKNDITGMFLDPPYSLSHRDKVYKNETDVFQEVCEWACLNGDNPRMRIAVCGYDDDFQFPETWEKYSWKGAGLSALGDSRGRDNEKKETIWFSPYCLKA